MKSIKEIVAELEQKLQCTCNFDKWEPVKDTGHTFVCLIHKNARLQYKLQYETGQSNQEKT